MFEVRTDPVNTSTTISDEKRQLLLYIPPFPGKIGMGRRHKFFLIFLVIEVRADPVDTAMIISDEKSENL